MKNNSHDVDGSILLWMFDLRRMEGGTTLHQLLSASWIAGILSGGSQRFERSESDPIWNIREFVSYIAV